MPFLLLFPALLILASYGAWCVVTGAFSLWHWLWVAAAFGALLLVVRWGWVEIGRLGKR